MSPAACFHCGEPATHPLFSGIVAGAPRRFCCSSCLAVATAIDGAGLADYYLWRSEPGPRPAESPPIPAEWFSAPEFAAAGEDARLVLSGVRCPACVWLIGERLRQLPEISAVELDYLAHTARLAWRDAPALTQAIAAVESLGYQARPASPAHRDGLAEQARRRDASRLIFALVAGSAVMNSALALYLAGTADANELWEQVLRWTSALVCLPLLAYSGADFFVGAWRDCRVRRLGMDVPIALGLAAAWLGSLPGLLMGGPVYFDSIAMLVAAVLGARWFETRARLRAAARLDRASALEPLAAHRECGNGESQSVPATSLVPGDRIRVRSGEVFPADGRVLAGRTEVDEACLTGEPHLLPRGVGDPVLAGSFNRGDAVTVAVERAGAASTLAELDRLIARGLASRPPVAERADRLASPLVALVLATAAATWFGWQAIDPERALPAAIAVLIVTCPCALALATPLALALGAARLAQAGVVPLRLAALEALAMARTVVFDKTGTLSLGAPRLAAVRSCGLDAATALRIAAALECEAVHPIAEAVRAAAPPPWPRADRVRAEAGVGLAGEVEGRRWWLGAASSVPAQFGLLRRELQTGLETAASAGRLTAVLVGPHGAAGFEFDDAPRAGLDRVAGQLRQEGVSELVCLSGDSPLAVLRIASGAGFDLALGGLLPADKLAWVAERQARGEQVMMVGDGLNDAATLAAADVALAFSHAPRAAQVQADFLLTGASLEAVARARAIARSVQQVMRQNLGWAVAYNLAAIPLAAAGWVSPWLAALGMAASSLLVVGNAWRLAPNADPARPRR